MGGGEAPTPGGRRDIIPQRSQTMPLEPADHDQETRNGNRNGVLWGQQQGREGGGYDFPQPRAPGLFSQPNHSSPTLASRSGLGGGGNGSTSPPLEEYMDHQQSQQQRQQPPPVLPSSIDDINLGLESMHFSQRERGRDGGRFLSGGGGGGGGDYGYSSGVGQDGAMEIRGNQGNTASVYSLDGGFGYGGGNGLHHRKSSVGSARTYGMQESVEGYSDDRPHSGGSYLPYDQPPLQPGGNQFLPPPLPNQQYGEYQPHPSTSTNQPYYPDPSSSTPNNYYPHPPQSHSYGPPPPHQQQQQNLYSSQAAPPSFQPQAQHGAWGFDYSSAAQQNPYYAAATGQLGFPGDGNGYLGGGGQGMGGYGAGNRTVSGGSLAPSLGAGTMAGGGSLSRSASSINLPQGGPRLSGRQSNGGGQQATGPPINKASVDEYRTRIKSDPDPEAQFNFAKYLIEAAKKISASASGDEKSAKKYRDALLAESVKLIKRLATQGNGIGKPAYADAQFFLANCLGNGSLGLQVDHEKAYNLYVQASKQNHPSATYRTAVCNEVGAGTRRDHARAVLFYRKASALGDTAGMYKLGMILLNGLLGQNKNPKEAVMWLKRAAQQADEDNPHALHELGLLYEKAPPPGQPGPLASILAFDPAQARQLFNDAATFNYAPSQYKLGLCFEYGTLTCPVDPRRSIAWYTRAAERGDAESELALSGWYLTGSEGILKQSDSEAYLWARRAANKGLPKAEYAVGYYSEVGIGVKQDLEEAKRWYMRAAAQGNKRAMTRLQELRELMKKEGAKGGKVVKADTRKR